LKGEKEGRGEYYYYYLIIYVDCSVWAGLGEGVVGVVV
jgi:hypothetical protein